MNKKYESVYLIKPYKDEKIIKNIIEKIQNIIKSENCNICETQDIGIKKLAYDIKNEKFGYYYVVTFEVKETQYNIDKKISKNINTVEDILKHMIIQVEE